MIAGVEQAIQSNEKVYNDYFNSINGINKEIQSLSSKFKERL
jgi:predicted nucleic acid-binding OB-fold protein